MNVTGPEKRLYKTIDGADLHVHIFRAAGETRTLPGMVFFHCGGHWNFEAGQFFPQSGYLASRGMVCLSAEVRVMPVHGTTPAECVVDAKSAIRWVRKHADELGVDTGRVAVGGGSAAGHVTACCGVVEGFDEEGEDLSIPSKPDAMLLFNPAVDYTTEARRVEKMGSLERARELSPVFHVKAGNPPALVMHGKADESVDVEQAIRFDAAMREAGNRCDLKLYDDAPHGFFNYRNGKNAWFYDTLKETDRFLASLGYIDGEERVDAFAFTEAMLKPKWA